MSEINFVITKAWPGSEAQKKVGIHATFTMNVVNSDGIVLTVTDMMLRTTKENKYYIESPFRSYTDKEGNNKKLHFVKFFPEKQNWNLQDSIVSLVLDEIKKVPARSATPSTQPAKTGGNSYSNKPKVAPKAEDTDEAW